MITGVPAEARWIRAEPRRTLPSSLVGRIVRLAFPQCSVVNAQPLTDGLRNANFRLRLDSTPEFIVLRIYEHDASLCQKELDPARSARRLGAGPGGTSRRAVRVGGYSAICPNAICGRS
jgi:hypothetical protein